MDKLLNSLSKKSLLALTIVFLPMLIAFFKGYHSINEQLKMLIFKDLTVIAEAYEGQVYQFLEMSKRRAQDFASDGFIRDQLWKINQGDKTAVGAINEHLVRNKRPLDKAIHDIHIISSGRIVASTDSSAIGKEMAVDSFVIGKEGGTIVTEGNHIASPGLLVSTPVTDRNAGKIIGILVNSISLTELNKVLSGESVRNMGAISWDRGRPKSLEVYLVNKERLMITESRFIKGSVLSQAVDTMPVNKCLQSSEESLGFYKDYQGKDIAGSSMCIPSLKWTLLVEIDKEEILASLKEIKRYALMATVAAVGLIGFLFIIFSRNVVSPLRRISNAAKDITDGNYDVTIPVQTSDEIGKLSEIFNTMTSEIRERTEALRAGTIALRESEESLKMAQRIARLGNWDWDIINNKLTWSEEIYHIFGLPPQEFKVTYEVFLSLVHPDDREFIKKAVEETLYKNAPYEIDHRIVLHDGTVRFVHEHAQLILDGLRPVRMIGTVQDVTEHKMAEMELKKLSMTIEHSVNIVFITDLKGNIEYVNPMFEKVTGLSKDEAIGHNPRILASGDITREEYEGLWNTIGAGKTWRGVFKNRKKDGQIYWANSVITPIKNEKGEISHFLAVQEDITDRKKTEERAQYLATYDEMTDLINRGKFMELLSEWVYYQSRADRQAASLLLIDIDHFKFINDTFGHGVGDELLRRMADMLDGMLQGLYSTYMKDSEGIILGRMGGDEFALFLPNLNAKEGMDVAERIRKSMEELRLVEAPIHSTVSIGVVSYPEHGETIKELFTKVDAAVYRAKETGRNRCHLYRPEDRDLENIQSRLKEKERVIKAISEDRFFPWLQPILSLKDGKIEHYEALARMRDEDGTILLPGDFIDTAERFGLIGDIDRIITEKTMRIQAEMAKQGRYLSFAMNLSGKNLGDDELLSYLQSRIRETGADASHLIFEITETAAVRDLDRAIKFISSLKSIGCRFSLDDFGVGFTSFVYLKELRVDYIKIDGSFIRKLNESPNDQLFVKAMTEVARGMGIKTIAEFVEKEEILWFLKEYGVDYAQGYFIGKPGPDLLAEGSTRYWQKEM